MLRRSLLQQSRQFCSAALTPKSSSSASPLISSQHRQRYLLSSRLTAPSRARILSRWYSDAATEKKAEDAPPAAADSGAAPATDAASAHAEEAAKKDKEILDLKDKYLRSVAEFRNLQDRTKRETQAAKDFAIQKFARDLIESIDNLDLALTNVPADKLAETKSEAEDVNKELRQLHGGLKMTESVLMNTLKKHGLERFDPSVEGETFDPNLHEATFMAPQPDKKDGSVFHTTQKGFMLNGRVLRAAKVGVVKNS